MAEADGADPLLAQALEHHAGGLHRVDRKSQGPTEHVRATRRDRGDHRNVWPWPALGQQAVDELVHGAVATEGHHDLGALRAGQPANLLGVAPVVGLDDLDVVLRRQRVNQHVARAGGGRGGVRVHHQVSAHPFRVGPRRGSPNLRSDIVAGVKRSGALVFVSAVGASEALMLLGYGASIIVFEVVSTTSGISGTTDLAGPVLAGLLMVFGALVGTVSWAAWNRRSSARTPYVVAQAFALVVGWTLASGDGAATRALGAALLVIAGAALVLMLARGAAELDR